MSDQDSRPLPPEPASEEQPDDAALEPSENAVEQVEEAEELAGADIRRSLVNMGFVGFDGSGASNNTASVLVSADLRRNFRRDAYVTISDPEQQIEFLGRVVEGPFHTPHDVSADSAISRTTLLHPDRTQFRPTYYAHGSIEILGEIRGEQVLPSPTRPRPYSTVSLFPSDRLRRMLGLEGTFFLGNLLGYSEVLVHSDVDSKNFLPRNVGVFGTVGSGKSNTTQVLIEEATDAGWAVIAVDVEGEYVRMNEQTTDPRMVHILRTQYSLDPSGVADVRVYVPSSGMSDAQDPIRYKVPIAQVQPEVLSDILEFSEPQSRMFGTITDNARRRRAAGGGRRGPLAGAAARNAAPYTLQDLIDGLDEAKNYPLAPNLGGVERSTAAALRSKLISLGRSGMLDWTATAQIPTLPVDELLVGGRLSVLDVSETDDRSRNIAIAYLLQSVFERVIDVAVGEPLQPGSQPRPRVLVVIEEVHTFVSRASASRMRAVLDQLQIISRRGRKRWMGLALVSQQPGHVPDELFELANTRFIHQLKSSSNLAPVRQTTGGVHEALWGTVPALGPGQCLLTGAVFRNPIFVAMRPARSRRMLVG